MPRVSSVTAKSPPARAAGGNSVEPAAGGGVERPLSAPASTTVATPMTIMARTGSTTRTAAPRNSSAAAKRENQLGLTGWGTRERSSRTHSARADRSSGRGGAAVRANRAWGTDPGPSCFGPSCVGTGRPGGPSAHGWGLDR